MNAARAGSELGERQRILVVDDERLIADTLAAILTLKGFTAMAAYDGTEAVDCASYWSPDLLLSDIVMPRMNGVEAAVKIREMYPRCKVILFSGQAAIETLPQNAAGRDNHFELLTKPIHPDELLAQIHQLLQRDGTP